MFCFLASEIIRQQITDPQMKYDNECKFHDQSFNISQMIENR